MVTQEQIFAAYLERTNAQSGFLCRNGILLTGMWPGGGSAEAVPGPESLDRQGRIHRGLLFSLADAVCGTAAATTGLAAVTVASRLELIAPPGEDCTLLLAESRPVGQDGTLGFYRAEVRDEAGTLLAVGSFTMCFSGAHPVLAQLKEQLESERSEERER